MNATSIISKVQKLLNTAADSAATPSESATALAIAQRLMAQHRITDAALREHALSQQDNGIKVAAKDLDAADLGPWQQNADGWLGMAAAEFCGCRAYRHYAHRVGDGTGKLLRGYGLPADLAVAREVYLSIRETAHAARKAYCVTRGLAYGNKPLRTNSVPARSFIDAFAIAILTKVRNARAEQRKSKETVEVAARPGSTAPMALVCVGEFEEQLESALVVKAKQMGLGVGRCRRTRDDWSARYAGDAAGRAVKLSREVIR